MMKKRFWICFVLLLTICCLSVKPDADAAKADSPVNLEDSKKMQEVLLAALIPEVRKAVDSYYTEYFFDPPTVDSFASGAEITEIQVNDGGSVFTITIEISPYQGAHNGIGRDRIVILADQADTKVISFEHLENYELLPWLNDKNDLKKPYPKTA